MSSQAEMEGQEPTSVVTAMMKEFGGMRDKKTEDEEAIHYSPFAGLDKATVMQEATKAFNDHQIVKFQPQHCCLLITKLLFLLAQGESFTGDDSTGVFFAVTKLFQSSDLNLRRMTYLFIKEVAETTDSEEIIIVFQSLTKDMNSQVDLYRANSIRVLCKIVDSTMLGQIERFIKQAVVDRNALTASSALISGTHLVQDPTKKEIVRRWINEVQEALNSPRSDMQQYHALALLHALKAHDTLAVNKLVTQMIRAPPKSSLAVCLLVRYTAGLLHKELSAAHQRFAFEFLDSCLRHKNEMVIYEAARAICKLPDVAASDLSPAINVLQMFLTSSKPTLRFAAVRTLNDVAMTHPLMVTKCNDDMEALIGDSNRSIATLAITTLLKTGSENSVDRLMKQITTFMSEIADEFKIVVIRAIRSLCSKYPAKNRVLLNFLSSVLRDEGGFDFKKVIVDTILDLMQAQPDTTESGLFHLCEFIEDCEFTHLSAQILHVLGELGPTTRNPGKYIRFIYNRVILENAQVRAAAASSLGKFAAKVPSLRVSVEGLLRRCLSDEDDEVRDRATIALSLLKRETPVAKALLVGQLDVRPERLLRSLEAYKLRPSAGPLTKNDLPDAGGPEEEPVRHDAIGNRVPGTGAPAGGVGGGQSAAAAVAAAEGPSYAEQLYKIPEFAALGTMFKSSPIEELTQPESEYLVRLVKHVFPEHVVLQFNLTNTVEYQLLTEVEVEVAEVDTENWEMECCIPVPKLAYDQTTPFYVCLRSIGEERDGSFECLLKFRVHELDPSTKEVEEDDEGFEEEFALDSTVELSAADFIKKNGVADFRGAWDSLGKDAEVAAIFQLPARIKTMDTAVAAVIDTLQMQPCEGTAAVTASAAEHIILLAGVFIGEESVLVRTKLAIKDGGVVLKIAVRAQQAVTSNAVLGCIGNIV